MKPKNASSWGFKEVVYHAQNNPDHIDSGSEINLKALDVPKEQLDSYTAVDYEYTYSTPTNTAKKENKTINKKKQPKSSLSLFCLCLRP